MSTQQRAVILNPPEHVGDERPTLRSGKLGEAIRSGRRRRLLPFARLLRRGCSADGAVLVVRGERLSTDATRVSLPRVGVLVVLLGDASLPEDISVEPLGVDVDVRLPHVRVQLPVDTVLDLLSRVPLADHPGDRGVPEVVRVARLLEVGPARDSSEVVVEVVGVDVPSAVFVPLEFVKEGRLRIVGARMREALVRAHRGDAVDEGVVFDLRTLQPDRVGVGAVGGCLALEVDVFDPERDREGAASAGVSEEFDKRDVALVVRRVDERRDVVAVEHVVGVDGRLVDGHHLELLCPLAGVMLQEEPEDALSVPTRRVGAAVVVPDLEEEVASAVEVELADRRLGEAGGQPELLAVLFERGDSQPTVASTDEVVNGVFVRLSDVRIVEPVELVAEALAETRRIIEAHTRRCGPSYKNSHVGKRFLINDETRKNPPREGLSSSGFAQSNQGVSA